MNEALLVSNIILWVAVVVLACVVAALARQLGVLYERVAPAGALMLGKGPTVGDQAPVISVEDIDGTAREIGAPGPRSTLLFFLSPTCPLCKELLPALRSAAHRESDWLDVVSRATARATGAKFTARRGAFRMSLARARRDHQVGKLPTPR
jgi:methylamine dehydrogenase accessory protein MauD